MHHRFFLPACLLVVSVGCCLPLSHCYAQQSAPSAPAGLTQYLFGSPSGDEVEMLECINRARANPAAEGQRLVAALQAAFPNGNSGYNYGQITSLFASYPVRPPLAFNVYLNAASKAHLADNIRLGTDAHNSPDGTTPKARVQQFGYMGYGGENCNGSQGYTVATRPETTNGGYELADPDHSDNVLETGSILGRVEVGEGFQSAGGWNVEDFGDNNTPPLLTGVVYNDDAGTGFYQSGEGVSYVLVTSNMSSFYAVTVNGAYALPLDLAPAYSANSAAPVVTVTFTTFGGSVSTQTVRLGHTVSSRGMTYYDANNQVRYDNTKADWVLAAHPAFFAGEMALSDGVYYLAFPANGNVFGYYVYLPQAGFLYHFDLGYEYALDARDGQAGVYLYDFASGGWFYTSPTFGFPYLYDFSLQAVLYYYPDPKNAGRYNTGGTRFFYNFATGQIISK